MVKKKDRQQNGKKRRTENTMTKRSREKDKQISTKEELKTIKI